jgi:hypothetical protein
MMTKAHMTLIWKNEVYLLTKKVKHENVWNFLLIRNLLVWKGVHQFGDNKVALFLFTSF